MAYRNLYIEANNVFKNRTFDDLLKPLAMYTDVYNQLEAESGELADKSNAFAYLSSTLPEGSESKRIYENYANELKAASDDMARNGLNIQNRKALVDLKRRYNGEIGRLQRADEALQREKELRRNASMKDPSMLYANDNLTIDNFLEGSNPNLYGISGNDLYKRGATASQQASSRVYDNTQVQNLTKYYQEMIQRYGYNPELLYAFREDLSAIPELEAEVDSILKETGVEDNLTGNNYARARESVINGMIDGALYREERRAMPNPGVLTAAESTRIALQREAQDREDAYNGRTWNPKTKTWSYDPANDMRLKEAASLTNYGNNGGGSGSNSSSGSGNRASYDTVNSNAVVVGANTGQMYYNNNNWLANKLGIGASDSGREINAGLPLGDFNSLRQLSEQEYNSLVDSNGNITNSYIRNAIGRGNLSDYEIWKIPKGSVDIDGTGWFKDDLLSEDVYVIIPRVTKRRGNSSQSLEFPYQGVESNDINDVPE